MDATEESIRRLLGGSALEEDLLCDFTLGDQNEAIVAKGVAPLAASDYVPIVSKTVTYIVLGVLINSKNEVLMMQEAKKSCAGQWYLPAGRMEPGETIEGAVKREVLEETGLQMKPTTLLLVESAGGSWFRFIFTGEVVGGTLKTPAQADAESLQAKWVENVNELSLRAQDVLDVIEKARTYYKWHKSEPWHDHIVPALKSHDKLYLRLVVCIKQKASNRVHVLLSEKTRVHLPVCEIYPARSLHATLRKFMIEIFGADLQLDSHKPHGLLNIEHNGSPQGQHDGLLLTVLVSFRVPLEEVYPIDKYTWVVVSKELEENLNLRIKKNMTVPLKGNLTTTTIRETSSDHPIAILRNGVSKVISIHSSPSIVILSDKKMLKLDLTEKTKSTRLQLWPIPDVLAHYVLLKEDFFCKLSSV